MGTEVENYTLFIILKAKLIFLLASLTVCLHLGAQSRNMSKLSHMLRMVAYQGLADRTIESRQSDVAADSSTLLHPTRAVQKAEGRSVMALVKCSDPGILKQEGCQVVRNWDNIYATSIPMSKLNTLVQHPEVQRIEAGRTCQLCIDTTATLLGVRDAWKGMDKVPGLSGRGVVMGIQDVGFDLTHPTFYSRDLKEYRIKAFWDMLDPDTIGSQLYVGRDYTTKDDLLRKAHATDGLKQTHGVHTSGIAAGSGYNSPYIGMAPEADLCFVANAVGSDAEFISEEDDYKYTATTDVLGFQYIFDYAERTGKPCVISFSEGAHEDLYGDAQLLYEVLEKMTGPGKVIVASAGNSSVNKTYLHKPLGTDSISSFIYSNNDVAYYTLRHSDKTDIRLHFSQMDKPGTPIFTQSITTDYLCSLEDSLLIDTLKVGNEEYMLLAASYPSCYNADEWATELYIRTLTRSTLGIGAGHNVRLTLCGRDMDVECFSSGGYFMNISSLPEYNTAVSTHNINFPAAAPCLIAVGGTAYRTGVFNYQGIWKDNNMGDDGRHWEYSSVGPSMQGLTKPDVVAPANNVISAYSSFYIENNPNARDVTWDVQHFDFQGRTYAWNSNSGTSMSAPVVGGIVALWLQLCPTLSPQDVMQVIQHTSRHNDPSLSYPNNLYGWGEIDAMAGAKYIAEHFECVDVTDIEALRNEASADVMGVYDLSGRRLPSTHKGKGLYLIKYIDGSTRKVMMQ